MRKKSLEQIKELLSRHQLNERDVEPDSDADASRYPAGDDRSSARAFEALRRSVEVSQTGTLMHQAHLAMVHRALLRAGGPKAPLILVTDLLRQVGVAVEGDVSRSELFTDHDGVGSGVPELVDPAYVDERNGRVVQQGIVSRRKAVSS